MHSRRDIICSVGAVAAAAIMPSVAVEEDTRIALPELVYLTAQVCRDIPECRGDLRMPRDDAAYENFEARYRKMTSAEESAWRSAISPKWDETLGDFR